MAKKFVLNPSGRLLPVVWGIALCCALLVPRADDARAQFAEDRAAYYSLDLSDYIDSPWLRPLAAWDTLRVGPVDRLFLGEYYSVPNFLSSDFERERTVEEYSPSGFRFRFRYPKTHRFEFAEAREGVFIFIEPRDLSVPGLEIKVESIDKLAEQHRRESLAEVWRETVLTSIQRQEKDIRGRRGPLNISLPVKLPSAVERLIGRGEETRIDISGRESITFSGESRRVNPFRGVEGQQKQPLFPSLDMKQELDVRLNGQVGEKINVQVDHTSSSLSTEQNRIRLNYTGFEDDVIQLIEMGDISLSLPGSQLVSFSGNSQGLFGIKVLAQAGPADITMIASKEEGETSRAQFSPRGGTIGQTEEVIIRDIDFIKNVYFFLDKPDADPSFFRASTIDQPTIEVYVSAPADPLGLQDFKFSRAFVDTGGTGSDIATQIAAFAADPNNPQYTAGFIERNFDLLTFGQDYRFVLNALDESVIGLEMLRSVPEDEALAVRYETTDGFTIGDINNNVGTQQNPLHLELIKAPSPRPEGQFGWTWSYMMRHIYNLGLSNIDEETLEVDILELANRLDTSTPDSSSVPWLRIFGLDRTDVTGVGLPDARIDLLSGLVDLQRGILTFPVLRPFDPSPDSVAAWTNGEFSFTGEFAKLENPDLYDKFLTRPNDFHLFNIAVRAASTTKTFTIDAFNISEGSEVVRLDGRELTRDRDYRIDYESGQVELIGAVLDELTPSSDITIDYEFKPFAGGASTTLLGMSSLLELSKNTKFGTTWLYESKLSPSDRPRLGEEPSRIVVGDVNGNVQYNPNFLTSLVNKLPLVDTEARSTFTLSGELAVSFPDPNTRGEVYIDDMEGVEDSDVFAVIRRNWQNASPPVDPTDLFSTLPANKREKIFWYNIEPDRAVHRRDLNPNLDERESTLLPSLDIEFDQIDDAALDPERWGGIMTGFRGGGLDLSQGQFIEIWINDFKPNPGSRGGVIHIDLGFIDEDFHRPDENQFNNEDGDRNGFTVNTEDTGFDGIFDGEPGDEPDDNYSPQRDDVSGRFERINGTENNGLLDTEDLDQSGQLDENNAYFSFKLPLSSEAVIDVRRDFPGFTDFTNPRDSWRLYRIDLSEREIINPDGTPLIEQVKHMRIWFDSVATVVDAGEKRIELTGFKVVGNRWETDGIRSASNDTLRDPSEVPDTKITLGVISTKTDPVTYNPPIQPNVDANQISAKEQSLLVAFDSLRAGDGFRVRKRFAGRGLDWTTYRDLNFFVHANTLDDSLEYFVQVAFDSFNYYEIRIPLKKKFFAEQKWAYAVVSLVDLSNLKFEPADSLIKGVATDLRDPSRSYEVRMVGLPSMFNVRFLYAGLRNLHKTPGSVSEQLWINDIFLGNRKKDVDFAQRFNGSLNMGNVVNLTAGWQRTGPDFRGLRQRRGSGADNQSIRLSVRSGLHHFLPLFGFKIPITGNYSRTRSLPKFTPNSDTEISAGALQDSLRTEATVRGFSTTLTRAGSKNRFLRYTFDKLKTNFSMSQQRRRSPAAADTALSMQGTLDYSINWGQNRSVRLWKNIRWRYWLNNFNFRADANRRVGKRFRNVGGNLIADPKTFTAFLNPSGRASYVPFRSLTSSFRMSTRRDISLQQHLFDKIDIGTEINRNHSMQVNFKPPPVWLIKEFQPDFDYRSNYREDSSPNVRRLGDEAGVRNVSNNRDASIKARFDLGKFFRQVLGRVNLIEPEPEQPSARGPATRQPVPNAGAPNDSVSVDSTAVVADTTGTRGRNVNPLIGLRKIGTILGGIRRVNVSVRQRIQSNYSRLPGRPDLSYQVGISQKSGVASGDELFDAPERINKRLSLAMDSGAQITNNIDLQGRFSRARTNSVFRNNDTETLATTWPDLSLNWKGLESWGPFGGLFTSTSLTFGLRKVLRETGRGGEIDNTNKDLSLTPSIVFAFKNGIGSTLSMQFTKNTADARGSITERSSTSIGLDAKYSFAPGKSLRLPLPFLRNRKLKSRLDTSVSMAYTKSSGKRASGNLGIFDPLPGSTSLRVSPRMTYNFSRAMNGSLFIDFTRVFNDVTDQSTTTVRVGLSAVFTF